MGSQVGNFRIRTVSSLLFLFPLIGVGERSGGLEWASTGVPMDALRLGGIATCHTCKSLVKRMRIMQDSVPKLTGKGLRDPKIPIPKTGESDNIPSWKTEKSTSRYSSSVIKQEQGTIIL